MESNSLVLQVAAFSGLIGALLTQAMTGLLAYYGDKRKSNLELKKAFRDKQIEVVENFYFVSGEKMAIVKKNIGFWKDWNNSRSEASLEFLKQEVKKLNSHMEKLESENWRYNLIGLYFDVSLTNEATIKSNNYAKQLYLQVLDLTDQIQHALDDEKGDLYILYDVLINDMCKHYEDVYQRMSNDMAVVKHGLLKKLAN